jgi:hypothetical protein
MFKKKYFFDELEPGDSFRVEVPDATRLERVRLNVAQSARNYKASATHGRHEQVFRFNVFNLSEADTERSSYVLVTRVK